MVLFQEDYKTHHGIIDTQTRNLSFIRMSVMLAKMGIKNNKFMLILTQPELQGVDPHAKNLSREIIEKIIYECKVNPWYYFREIVRIEQSGGNMVYYTLNRANLALLWLFLNNINVFLTMPRQIGKTTGTMGIVSWTMFVAAEAATVGLFAKGNKLRTENVARLKEIRDALPKYLYLDGIGNTNDNQEGLEYMALGNEYKTFVATSDKKNSAAAGRGESHIYQQWDEIAYYTNCWLAYQSAKSATNTAGQQARDIGIPAANIITTTAGNLATEEGRYAYKMKSSSFRFTETLYDCVNNEELTDLVKSVSDAKMVYCEFSHKQLGKDDVWFREVTAGLDQSVIDADYRNKWTYGGEGSVVPKELLDKLSASVMDSIYNEINNKLLLRWYAQEEVVKSPAFIQTPFVIAADTSDAIGNDFTTIVIINPLDMAVIMTCKCNNINTTYISKLLIHLLKRFPRSVLIPERNRSGGMLIDTILHHFVEDSSFDPFKRIYNQYVQNWTPATPPFHTLDIGSGTVRKAFGFNTTAGANSRDLLYSHVLMTTIKRNFIRIFDCTIIDEIKGLTKDGGRVDHSSGNHDDMLVAYLIACWYVMYGKNHSMYGTKTNEILKDATDTSAQNEMEKERISRFRRRISDITNTLKTNISQMLKYTLESELRQLKALIPDGSEIDDNVISLHQISREVRQEREGEFKLENFRKNLTRYS